MAEGLSLHLGLNRLDRSHYGGLGGAEEGGWEGVLVACEQDAIDLQAIASAQGFTTSTLLTEAATVEAVTRAVREGAASLSDGDMFVMTFASYGGEVPDRNSDERWRERTWALYDRQMPEDEVMSLLASFRPNVRVLVIDDSSAAGTMRRDALSFVDLALDADVPSVRALPADVAIETYRSHSGLYDEIQRSCTSSPEAVIRAAVVIIASCMANQLAADGTRNGLFTETLRRVWRDGQFEGDYKRFVKEVVGLMPPTQSPQLTERGSGEPFIRERPFTI